MPFLEDSGIESEDKPSLINEDNEMVSNFVFCMQNSLLLFFKSLLFRLFPLMHINES